MRETKIFIHCRQSLSFVENCNVISLRHGPYLYLSLRGSKSQQIIMMTDETVTCGPVTQNGNSNYDIEK